MTRSYSSPEKAAKLALETLLERNMTWGDVFDDKYIPTKEEILQKYLYLREEVLRKRIFSIQYSVLIVTNDPDHGITYGVSSSFRIMED